MIKTVFRPEASDKIQAISSKSEIHRLLICAALSDKKTEIVCENINEDIMATTKCLKALGAEIEYDNGIFTVLPVKSVPENPVLFCNESGSTLRFLLPICARLCENATFETKGRLASRPLSPLKEELEKGNTRIKTENSNILVSGKNKDTHFEIAGNVSSQFISGLMFMLTFTGGEIIITNSIESRPYIEMTIEALRLFGCNVSFSKGIITVEKKCPLTSPEKIKGFGDWSNAAFFIAAGVTGQKKITVTGLKSDSFQGDRKIIEILKRFGAEIEISDDEVTAFPSVLSATDIDARDIPDLVPVLSVVATRAKGKTKISGCERLRLKESDRIEAVKNMISSLGGKIEVINDEIIIEGCSLSGGVVNSENDHRIAMSAAVAAFFTTSPVTINDAQAVNKSYPSFWDELK